MCVSQMYSKIYLGSELKCDSILFSSLWVGKEEDKGDVEADREGYDKAGDEDEGNVEVDMEDSNEERDLEGDGGVVDKMADCNRGGDQVGDGQVQVDVLVDGQIHDHRSYHDHIVEGRDDRNVDGRSFRNHGNHFHNHYGSDDVYDFHSLHDFHNHVCFRC